MNRRWFFGLVAAAVVTAIAVFVATRFPGTLSDQDSQIDLVHAVLVLALVGSSALLYRGMSWGKAFRGVVAWVGIFAVLIVGYAYRHELGDVWQRVTGVVVPYQAQVIDGQVVIEAGRDGHFTVAAEVPGPTDTAIVRFLVDTGASDVTLSPADAKRLGFDVASLDFSRRYATANGIVLGAPVRLERVAIGPIARTDVRASVNGAEMRRSLLGMSFLSTLRGYEVTRDRLILRP